MKEANKTISIKMRIDFENENDQKYEFLHEVSQDISEQINNKRLFKDIKDALIEREKQNTTGFGNHLAMPHGKVNKLVEPYLLFYRLRHPVEWESLDEAKVTTIFVILVPENNADNMHLQMLSKLAYNLMDEEYQFKIKTSNDSLEIEQLIDSIFHHNED